ncbi:MAG: hypothetical protein QF437_18990, partial [Planctomycetota bacterium]|nr:hypothetical protein [Planctomycetota bacterium]
PKPGLKIIAGNLNPTDPKGQEDQTKGDGRRSARGPLSRRTTASVWNLFDTKLLSETDHRNIQ